MQKNSTRPSRPRGGWRWRERASTATTLLALGVVAALTTACAVRFAPPDLGELYNRAAQHHGPDRNPIIVIPGLTGSTLVDGASNRVVWGAFAGDYARPGRPEDMRLIALPMQPGVSLKELRDDVHPGGVLDRVQVRVLGVPLVVRAYVEILAALGAGGYRDESLGLSGAVDYGSDHYTCFQFDYDWRRDNVETAQRLARFLAEKRVAVREESRRRFGVDPGEVRFDVVAHSMGALSLRYFLRYGSADLPEDGSIPAVTWAGAEYVDRVILVAPPNAGSLESLFELIDGHDPGPFIPTYSPAILGTFPSIYQLLPRGRHGVVTQGTKGEEVTKDPFDLALWEDNGWGLASPNQAPILEALLPHVTDPAERHEIAIDHLRKSLARARQLTAALDQPAPRPPSNVEIYLAAGDAVPTLQSAHIDPATGRLRPSNRAPGDGTVLRSSALLDEREGGPWTPELQSPIPWKEVLFLFTDHLGLTRDLIFTDNVLFWLLEQPRPSAAPEAHR
ncbi:MAG: hypothetical protein K8J08_22380 [Thermoanaerobaculia bacterium]|nr:hypothetical protein [Thermoanaerobaculia bacterium]